MIRLKLPIKTAEIYTCAFTRDGAQALIGAQGNPVGLWDLTRGQLLCQFEHPGPVWALAWSSDQRHFLTLDGSLRLWDSQTGACVRDYGDEHARSLAWDAAGNQVLSGSHGEAQLTDLASGVCRQRLKGHGDTVYCLAFDSSGHRALSGSRDRAVRVWDLSTGTCMSTLWGHTYHVHGVLWSAAGQRAISCAKDIRLWDLARGECLRVMGGHTAVIRTIRLSADGQRLVSASHDRTVRVWDARTGDRQAILRGHPVGVIAAEFGPDERHVFSCDWDGGIGLWEVPPG